MLHFLDQWIFSELDINLRISFWGATNNVSGLLVANG